MKSRISAALKRLKQVAPEQSSITVRLFEPGEHLAPGAIYVHLDENGQPVSEIIQEASDENEIERRTKAA